MTTQRSRPARLAPGLAAMVLLSLVVTGHRPTDASPSSDGPLAATFEAHGGLDRWQARRSFSYLLDGFPLSPQVARRHRSTVDLRNRYNRIEGEGGPRRDLGGSLTNMVSIHGSTPDARRT